MAPVEFIRAADTVQTALSEMSKAGDGMWAVDLLIGRAAATQAKIRALSGDVACSRLCLAIEMFSRILLQGETPQCFLCDRRLSAAPQDLRPAGFFICRPAIEDDLGTVIEGICAHCATKDTGKLKTECDARFQFLIAQPGGHS